MKARGQRPSAFVVSRCLEPLMKHEARGLIWLLKQGCAFLNSASFANFDVNIVVNSGK